MSNTISHDLQQKILSGGEITSADEKVLVAYVKQRKPNLAVLVPAYVRNYNQKTVEARRAMAENLMKMAGV